MKKNDLKIVKMFLKSCQQVVKKLLKSCYKVLKKLVKFLKWVGGEEGEEEGDL
jgi:hypothetical protein